MYNPTSPKCTVHICLDGCLPFEHGYLTRDCTLLKKYDSSHKGINCQQRLTGVGLHTHLLLAVGILSALSLHSPCACCHSCEFKCSAALLCACSCPTLLVLLKQFLACTWIHAFFPSLPGCTTSEGDLCHLSILGAYLVLGTQHINKEYLIEQWRNDWCSLERTNKINYILSDSAITQEKELKYTKYSHEYMIQFPLCL